MDFVLGFPLILLLLSSGYAKSELPSNKCYAICPAGYYKTGLCNNPDAKYSCRKCHKNTYTEVENSHESCFPCKPCKHTEVQIQACNTTRHRVCDCQEGYYYTDGDKNFRECRSCTSVNESENNSDYKKKCKRQNTSPAPPPNPFVTVTVTKTKLPNRTGPRDQHLGNSMPWLIFWIVVVIFVVAALLLLLIILISTDCRITNKGAEKQVKSPNEHHSYQGGRPTTTMFQISEETHDPVRSQPPVSGPQLLLNAEREARKQDEHLPAIVLYAIIKEVPLRRWKEFLRLLSVADQQLERVELETGFGLSSMEKQYQMLRLWSQRSAASLSDVFSALHSMDLAGCAQLLQENLEKLEWRPESK